MRLSISFAFLLVGFLLQGQLQLKAQIPAPTDAPRPLSPDASAAAFVLPAGFRMEWIASEPQIAAPTGICWDEQGRMFVTELHGYNLEGQLDIEELNKTGTLDTQVRRVEAGEQFKIAARRGTYGVVKWLSDTNGDGRIDRAIPWATNLPPAYGLVPARQGVIVACAPDIVYLADRDGDGHPEIRQTLFTGFRTGALERGVNSPQWGPDGWIYFGRGWGGGTITGPNLPRPVQLPGTDFRIRSDGSAIEPITGGTHTFGFAFTETGDRFVMTTTVPGIFIAPLPWLSLARNPDLAATGLEAPTGDRRVYSLAPPHPWRTKRAQDPAYFKYYRDRYGPAESEAAGWFTSGCGPLVYQDSVLPGLQGHYFACEPSGNLIHRAIPKLDGTSLSLHRHPDESRAEFAASRDPWSHPIALSHGPDGTIWVVDYYREIIEDYSAIPRHLQQQYGLYAGHDRGRILRLTHRSAPKPPSPNLARLSPNQLARELQSPLLWRRQTAQRLLLERPDSRITPTLVAQLNHRNTPTAGRIATLRTLDALAPAPAESLIPLLDHPALALRVHTLQVIDRLLRSSLPPQPLIEAVLQTATREPEPRVQLQYALTLGGITNNRVLPILASLAHTPDPHRWIGIAVLSSLPGQAHTLLPLLLPEPGASRTLFPIIGQVLGARRNPGELSDALALVAAADSNTKTALLASITRSLRTPSNAPLFTQRGGQSLARFQSDPDPAVRDAALQLASAAAVQPPAPTNTAAEALPTQPARPEITESAFRSYIAALDKPRNLSRGMELFVTACAPCHRIDSIGNAIGPDIIGELAGSEEALLRHVLYPDERIRPGYETTVAIPKSGPNIIGILTEDGATSATLLLPGGQESVLLKQDLQRLQRIPGSLMPSFADALSPADMADLLGWLRSRLGAPR